MWRRVPPNATRRKNRSPYVEILRAAADSMGLGLIATIPRPLSCDSGRNFTAIRQDLESNLSNRGRAAGCFL